MPERRLVGSLKIIDSTDVMRFLSGTGESTWTLSTFVEPNITNQGSVRNYFVTRLESTKPFKNAWGLMVHLDHLNPSEKTEIFNGKIKVSETPYPSVPFYRIRFAQSNNVRKPVEIVVDDAFEPSIKILHDRFSQLAREKAKESQGNAATEIERAIETTIIDKYM